MTISHFILSFSLIQSRANVCEIANAETSWETNGHHERPPLRLTFQKWHHMAEGFEFYGKEAEYWTWQTSTDYLSHTFEREGRSRHGRNVAGCLHSRQPFTQHCCRHLCHFTERQVDSDFSVLFKVISSAETIPRKLKHVPWKGSESKNPGTFWCHPCAKPLRRCH